MPDRHATDAVEINTTDVIYVEGSTISANASSERVLLLCTTVNPMNASSFPEHGTLLHMDALEDSGIITFHISGMECSSLDNTLPLFQDLSFESPMTPSMSML